MTSVLSQEVAAQNAVMDMRAAWPPSRTITMLLTRAKNDGHKALISLMVLVLVLLAMMMKTLILMAMRLGYCCC